MPKDSDKGDTLMRGTLEAMALNLLALGAGDNEEKDLEAHVSGEFIRMRVRNHLGEIVFNVIGKDSDELGAQLTLACLHKLSTDHLRVLHHQPLKGALRLHRSKK